MGRRPIPRTERRRPLSEESVRLAAEMRYRYGLRTKEIAEKLGVPVQALYRRQREPLYKQFAEEAKAKAEAFLTKGLEDAHAALLERLKREAPLALEKLAQLRDGAEKETVQLDAAKAILSFHGSFSGQASTAASTPDPDTFKVGDKVALEFEPEPKREQPPLPPPDEPETVN